MSAPTAPLPQVQPVDFRALFASLPADDPDRHDLDPLDSDWAHLAPGYPETAVAS